jgi:hypothetical protein
VAFFNPAFDTPQWAVFDFDAHAFPDRRRKADFQVGFQRAHHLVQLPYEQILVGNFQKIGHMIPLQHHPALVRRDMEENITRKKRFLENHSFTAIFMNRLVTQQPGIKLLPLAKLLQLFLAARARMGGIPKQLAHAHQLVRPPERVSSSGAFFADDAVAITILFAFDRK